MLAGDFSIKIFSNQSSQSKKSGVGDNVSYNPINPKNHGSDFFRCLGGVSSIFTIFG